MTLLVETSHAETFCTLWLSSDSLLSHCSLKIAVTVVVLTNSSGLLRTERYSGVLQTLMRLSACCDARQRDPSGVLFFLNTIKKQQIKAPYWKVLSG